MLSGGYTSPPYACAYSYGAKRGENSLLAVSTEEGSVHLLRTAKRDEWDAGVLYPILQPPLNAEIRLRTPALMAAHTSGWRVRRTVVALGYDARDRLGGQVGVHHGDRA